MNQINELWLPRATDQKDEIIISPSQNKDVDKYSNMLATVFGELGRVIKKDKNIANIAIVFHAAKASVWRAFSDAIQQAELEIIKSSFLDKTQSSFKQVVSKSSVQGDPLFLLRKRDGAKKSAQTDIDVLEQIVRHNPHQTDIEKRHCFSLYIGKCMEKGIVVSLDAKQVYEYIEKHMEVKVNDDISEARCNS